jgi:hypothetical protein
MGIMFKLKSIVFMLLTVFSTQIQNREERSNRSGNAAVVGGLGLLIAAGVYGGYKAYRKFSWPNNIYIRLDDALNDTSEKKKFLETIKSYKNEKISLYEIINGEAKPLGINDSLQIQYHLTDKSYNINWPELKIVLFMPPKKQSTVPAKIITVKLNGKKYDLYIWLTENDQWVAEHGFKQYAETLQNQDPPQWYKKTIESYLRKKITKKEMSYILKNKKNKPSANVPIDPDMETAERIKQDKEDPHMTTSCLKESKIKNKSLNPGEKLWGITQQNGGSESEKFLNIVFEGKEKGYFLDTENEKKIKEKIYLAVSNTLSPEELRIIEEELGGVQKISNDDDINVANALYKAYYDKDGSITDSYAETIDEKLKRQMIPSEKTDDHF